MNNEKKKCDLKKEDIYPFLDEYYKLIGRENPPPFREYSLQELKKCLVLFNINLQKVYTDTDTDTHTD
jgi:hypothetical protein